MPMIFLFLIGLVLAIVVGFWLIGQLVGLAIMLLIAGLIGALAQSVLKYNGGFLFSIGAGLVGAALGAIAAKLLGLPSLLVLGGLPVVWATVGSLAVVAAAKVVNGDGRRLTGGPVRLR
jgi:uncharacterized membrane protein YeaQ/YmgE (transglycosylase-associated protein family)